MLATRALRGGNAALEAQWEELLAAADGQILTTLPGIAVVRAASFAAHSLPISRFPDAEHRNALMGIAWGLSRFSPSFAERDAEYRGGMAPIQARVALARHACRLSYRLLVTQEPFDEQAYRRGRHSRGR